MDRVKLLKIFHLCNDVLLKIQEKRKSKYLIYKEIRSRIEFSMKNDQWVNSSEILAIAFMYGYDASARTYQKYKHLIKKKENDKELLKNK